MVRMTLNRLRKLSNYMSFLVFLRYITSKTLSMIGVLYFLNRSSDQRCSIKKSVLRNFAKFTEKHLCQSLLFHKVTVLRPATLLKKRMAQVFSSEFCEISKNTFLYGKPLVAVSVSSPQTLEESVQCNFF